MLFAGKNKIKSKTYKINKESPYTKLLQKKYTTGSDVVEFPKEINYIPSSVLSLNNFKEYIFNCNVIISNLNFGNNSHNPDYTVIFNNIRYKDGLASPFAYSSTVNYVVNYKEEMPDEIKYLTDRNIGEGSNYLYDGISHLRDYLFSNRKSLTSITIPDTVISIGKSCFNNSGLNYVEFPKYLKSIDEYAFYQSHYLESFDLSNSKIEYIGQYAFSYCDVSMKNVNLSNCSSLFKMDSDCFLYSSNLETVDLSNCSSLEELSSNCFSKCSKLTSIDLSGCNKLRLIRSSCFSDCSSLERIEIPDSVSVINTQCFSGCSKLNYIKLPNNIKELSDSLFAYCSSLKYIEIPESVTYINSNTFSGCSDITIRICKEPNSISGAPWGATNATIQWNSANIEYTLTPEDSTLYIGGEKVESSPYRLKSLEDTTYTAYHKDYLPVSGELTNLEVNQTYTINPVLTETNGYRITISPDQTDAIITMGYGEFSVKTNSILVPTETELTYTITKKGYKTINQTIIPTESQTISHTMEISIDEEVNLSYPFDSSLYSTFTLDNLVDGSNFIVDDSTTAIINGSNSYNVNSGASYGYIEFTTPDEETSVSITGYVSSENNWDFGAVYIGTAIYQPTYLECRNKTTDGNGEFLLSQSATSNASETYTTTLQPSTKYYLNFAYVKDGSGNSGNDRMYITNIQFKSTPV